MQWWRHPAVLKIVAVAAAVAAIGVVLYIFLGMLQFKRYEHGEPFCRDEQHCESVFLQSPKYGKP